MPSPRLPYHSPFVTSECHSAFISSFILYPLPMPIAAGGFGNDITVNVIASVIASALLLAAGFLWGKYKERQRFGKKLEEYDFYPYAINRDNFPEFSLKDFRLGMHYFLRNFDPTAARQLIFIGEQNNVRCPARAGRAEEFMRRLFDRYDGKKIADDTRGIPGEFH